MEIRADYLVIGAGATGLAFTDVLVAESDATVIVVDRHDAPGGHWLDAYPYVHLHMPSAVYGVDSLRLGQDRILRSGPNAGYYEQASAAEICAYYEQVAEHLTATGRVRFLLRHDHVSGHGDRHQMVSLVTGEEVDVRARTMVDATYVRSSVPATHTRPFEAAAATRVVTPGELTRLREPADGFTVLGAGKTAMDACTWLLGHGVDPDDIRWVRPRDPWTLDREFVQPLDRVSGLVDGLGRRFEAAAEAEGLSDLYARVEAAGQIRRFDPEVTPDMCHGATLSRTEYATLRRITDVVRRGKVRRVDTDQLVLDGGTVPTRHHEVYVDCTARGIPGSPPKPVFADGLVTPQYGRFGQVCFNAAMVGFLEASDRSIAEKNRLFRPNPLPSTRTGLDWAWAFYVGAVNENAWQPEPDLQAWLGRTRLNIARAVPDHLGEPRTQQGVAAIARYGEAAVANLRRLLGDGPPVDRSRGAAEQRPEVMPHVPARAST